MNIKINQGIVSILGRRLYTGRFALTVLRELIQNSLDANASEIVIDWNREDRTLAVSDNGDGIDKIDGLLDTIGASIKSAENPETIGGYGIAKLAIFACEEWEFISRCGCFYTGFNVNESVRVNNGAIVKVKFRSDDISYNFHDSMIDYVNGVDRKVNFTINGKPVTRQSFAIARFGNRDEIVSNLESSEIVVRVNGLPTFSTYISGLNKTVYLDYAVTCNPYDEAYPLTSSRDAFRYGTLEYNDYQERKQAILTKLEFDKKLEEKIKKSEKAIHWRGQSYISGGDVSLADYDEYGKELLIFKKVVFSLAKHFSCDKDYSFGLSDGTEENAYYSPSSNNFCIAKKHFSRGEIISFAIHEFVHFLGYPNHDQGFATEVAILTALFIDKEM